MSDKLDRSRDYATVYGDPHVRFSQDGNSYKADGTLYLTDVPIPASTPVAVPQETTQQRRNKQRSEAMKRYWDAKNAKKAAP